MNCSSQIGILKRNESFKMETNTAINLPLNEICGIASFGSKTKLPLQEKIHNNKTTTNNKRQRRQKQNVENKVN